MSFTKEAKSPNTNASIVAHHIPRSAVSLVELAVGILPEQTKGSTRRQCNRVYRPKMSRDSFIAARGATRDFLARSAAEHHMFHSPATDRYWSEPFRLMILNMEAYGYGGHCDVDRDTLIDWLYDAGNTGTRTTRYSLAILSVLLKRLERLSEASWDALQTAYGDDTLLEETLDRTVYFNIRPETNDRKEQDYAAIAGVGSSEIGKFIWAEIQALEPHVILVGGQAGLAALNGVAAMNPPIPFRGSSIHPSGLIIQSISHPSRPQYEEWASVIEGIAQRIEESNKSAQAIP